MTPFTTYQSSRTFCHLVCDEWRSLGWKTQSKQFFGTVHLMLPDGFSVHANTKEDAFRLLCSEWADRHLHKIEYDPTLDGATKVSATLRTRDLGREEPYYKASSVAGFTNFNFEFDPEAFQDMVHKWHTKPPKT